MDPRVKPEGDDVGEGAAFFSLPLVGRVARLAGSGGGSHKRGVYG